MNLKRALKKFLNYKKRSPATIEAYRWLLQRHIKFLGETRDVKDITFDDLDDWGNHLNSQKLAEATVSKRLRETRAFWNWLVRRRYIPESPFDVEIPSCRPKALRNRAISEEDRNAMLAEARNGRNGLRDYAIVRFLTDVGCRAGGLYRLKIRDIDFEDRSAQLHEKYETILTGYYTEQTAQALRAWLAVRPKVEHDHVFVSTRKPNRPLNRRSLYLILRRIAERAGVKGRFNAHSWRHEVGRRFLKNHVPPTVLQAKLGHSSVALTLEYYGNQDEDELRDATNRLSPRVEDDDGKRKDDEGDDDEGDDEDDLASVPLLVGT